MGPVSVLLIFLAGRLSSAQEIIRDPDNPLTAPAEQEADEGGPERLFDPENPRPPSDDPSIHDAAETTSTRRLPSWLSGSVRTRLYADTRIENDLEDAFWLQNRLQMRAGFGLSDHWRAVLEGRLEHWLWGQSNPDGVDLLFNGRNTQGLFEATLRDAYVSAHYGHWFITLGNQTIVWGAGTLSQPAAVINPVDLRTGVYDSPADQRIPIPAAEVSFVSGGFGLSGVLVPFFEPHAFNVFGSDFSLFNPSTRPSGFLPVFEQQLPDVDPSLEAEVQDISAITERPEATPRNASAGARLTSTRGGVDVGLGYFFGWDRLPFAEETAGTDGSDELVSTYRREHLAEADLLTFFGRVGVRVEGTLSPERTTYLEPADPTDPNGPGRAQVEPIRLPVSQLAASLSYEDSASLLVQVEGLWRHTFDLPAGRSLVSGDIDDVSVLFLGVLGLDYFRRPGRSAWGDLSFRVSGVVGVPEGDLLLYPSITWGATETIDIGAGAMLFAGPDPAETMTVGGLFDENDQVWVSLDAVF